ncbi:hypothetical protein LAZ67_2000941 [Cordylochernes scorpioides]|uniref:Uncharacterized protein n=1 Tax=Cordylochernes scorpioides TaxID=51811 RepID=A0ABY6K145_9ARAC|nr:hypothetical protein LAZ67_2000941 [Cordylochernes scorpioides]
MRRVAAKFVPKLLNCDQKQHRMNIANEVLDSVRDDPNLPQRVITGTKEKKEALRVYLENSVVAGIPQIARSEGWISRLKTFLFLSCWVGFFYQTFAYLQLVFNRPVVLNIEIVVPEFQPVPAITICATNWNSQDKEFSSTSLHLGRPFTVLTKYRQSWSRQSGMLGNVHTKNEDTVALRKFREQIKVELGAKDGDRRVLTDYMVDKIKEKHFHHLKFHASKFDFAKYGSSINDSLVVEFCPWNLESFIKDNFLEYPMMTETGELAECLILNHQLFQPDHRGVKMPTKPESMYYQYQQQAPFNILHNISRLSFPEQAQLAIAAHSPFHLVNPYFTGYQKIRGYIGLMRYSTIQILC